MKVWTKYMISSILNVNFSGDVGSDSLGSTRRHSRTENKKILIKIVFNLEHWNIFFFKNIKKSKYKLNISWTGVFSVYIWDEKWLIRLTKNGILTLMHGTHFLSLLFQILHIYSVESGLKRLRPLAHQHFSLCPGLPLRFY